MPDSGCHFGLLLDERLAVHATGSKPAWLWTVQGELLWVNAQGAALLGGDDPAALVREDNSGVAAMGAQVARFAPSLPSAGTPRLERLRGIGGRIGAALTCLCSRLRLADGGAAVLVVASDSVRPLLPLAERVRRLLATAEGRLAALSPQGELLHAGGGAEARLAGDDALATIGAEPLAQAALRDGRAAGPSRAGALAIERLGEGDSCVLLVRLLDEAAPAPVAAEEPAASVAGADAEVADAAQAPVDTNDADAAAPHAAEAASRREAERRHPLRFVWQTDSEGRFTLASREFADLVEGPTPALLGSPWTDIAAALGLDPEARVARAIASHDTFSGIAVAWPVGDAGERWAVELSGLPVFDRNRAFCGYRGFGVCRQAPPRPGFAPASGGSGAADGADAAEANAQRPPAQRVAPAEARPSLSIVPPAKNVVPFRGSPPAADKRPSLTAVERIAFREIGKALTGAEGERRVEETAPEAAGPRGPAKDLGGDADTLPPIPSAFAPGHGEAIPTGPSIRQDATALLDRLAIGILICRGNLPVYANRTALDWTGYADVADIATGGGLEHLLARHAPGDGNAEAVVSLLRRNQETIELECRLVTVTWDGAPALMLQMLRAAGARAAPIAPAERTEGAAEAEARELRSILDTATDGVIVIDAGGNVQSLNRSAEALFGQDARELIGKSFVTLFAPESHRAALDYFDGLLRNGVASLLNDGRDVIGRTRQGGLIPLFMTMGRVGESGDKFCAVLRDITPWKKAEEDLLNAKRLAEKSSLAKSDFLAKLSHEIRTPLNAVLGFSEVMMEERFGPVGNERYRDYLRDIHASGEHLISLLNDLLDLSKIEAGKLDLKFVSVRLNEIVQQCVALMQPQANRERIIIRTSLLPNLPAVVVDARSVRQIALNLLSNSIKFTEAGGQVIVSTAFTEAGEVILRVRDTGVGMTEQEIQTAMEPFRQLATSDRWGSAGTGLGLPLTKALAEANRAQFRIQSGTDSGTLVEIIFPATRVLAE